MERPTMLTKIIYATVAILAIGTAAQAQPPGTLAPKGLIINRNSSGGITSARTIGGNAPGGSTTPSGLSGPGFGGTGFFQGSGGGAPSHNFFLGNSVNSQNAGNAKQGTQVRQTTQANCNGKGLCWSDLRLKRNAELIAHLDNGLNLYRYSYNWSDQLYVGVMAQEVARLAPEAVVRGENGFLRVDYRRLGLRMQTWDEWSVSH
jgi:hypothetical protein